MFSYTITQAMKIHDTGMGTDILHRASFSHRLDFIDHVTYLKQHLTISWPYRRGYPDCLFSSFFYQENVLWVLNGSDSLGSSHWECLIEMVQMSTTTNIFMEKLEKYIPPDKSAL